MTTGESAALRSVELPAWLHVTQPMLGEAFPSLRSAETIDPADPFGEDGDRPTPGMERLGLVVVWAVVVAILGGLLWVGLTAPAVSAGVR